MEKVVFDWQLDFYEQYGVDLVGERFIHRVTQPATCAVIPRKGETVVINLHSFEVVEVKYYFESNHVIISVRNNDFPKPYPEGR